MGNNYWKSKKGTTMVEVLAAVLILAIVVTAVLTSISFSQRTILSESTQGDAAAQAQNLADTLIAKLHGQPTVERAKEAADSITDAEMVDDFSNFPSSDHTKQFTFKMISDGDAAASGTVTGYAIKVGVPYTDSTGSKWIQMTAFAAIDG